MCGESLRSTEPDTFKMYKNDSSFPLLGRATIAGAALAMVPGASALSVADFGARPDDFSDSTPAVAAALKACREQGARTLTFAPGRYDFYPEKAGERYLFVSNNDEGLKRIAFDLSGVRDFRIEGRGARFVFHGFICPFYLEKSGGVVLRDFSIDYARPFHSEGEIFAVDEEGAELGFSSEFPHEIRNGVLVFTSGDSSARQTTSVTSGEVIFPYGSLLEFDPAKRETAFMARDYWVSGGIAARRLPSGRVKLLMPGIKGTPGNVLVFGAARRDVPGFIISESRDVRLEDINLYHCGGMGVIAQRSRDIVVERMKVTPPPGGRRIVSLTADATHFVNCSGRVVLKDCVFEAQKDDATNVHGIYHRITRRLGPGKVEVKLVHPQQAGLDFIRPGMTLELSHGPSLVTYGEAEVRGVERINKEYSEIEFTGPLPSGLVTGDIVANTAENESEVVISGCVIRGNRARGILLGSRGRILVEGNTFHTPGAAILLEGDGCHWFEQAGVRDLVIRGNTFENCNYGVWGEGVISVGSGIVPEERARSRYNRGIVIEENTFLQFDASPILNLYSVDGLTYRNNRREQTAAYPSLRKEGPRFVATDSDHIRIEE